MLPCLETGELCVIIGKTSGRERQGKGMRKVSVIAGTPVDTQMGVDFLKMKNTGVAEDRLVEPLYRPVAEDCDVQVRFQYSDNDEKHGVMDSIFDADIADGVRDFFIYCNSLSGAFGFDRYALRKSLESGADIRIYTPLQVYRKLGEGYSRIGLIAANNLSAHAIEEALMSSNQDLYVIGSGNMAVVRAIEEEHDPERIIGECGLGAYAEYVEACGAEALLLGCTHFPYLRTEFEKVCGLPVIDPADMMYEALTEQSESV